MPDYREALFDLYMHPFARATFMPMCPTCGQQMPRRNYETGEALANVMRAGNRDCYLGQDGGYHLSHGAGHTTRKAINEALAAGLIGPKWNERPDLEYWSAR